MPQLDNLLTIDYSQAHNSIELYKKVSKEEENKEYSLLKANVNFILLLKNAALNFIPFVKSLLTYQPFKYRFIVRYGDEI